MSPFQGARFLPGATVEALTVPSASEFLAAFGGVRLLLVRLDPLSPDLLDGLTEMLAADERAAQAAINTTAEMRVVSGAEDPARAVDPSQLELLSRLETHTHFIVPLVPRVLRDEEDGRRLQVGRARDSDVVLLDAAISGHHAWFELDRESGWLAVVDAGSRNGTRINGRDVKPRRKNWLQPMDQVTFGSVCTFVCEPALLRALLRMGAGAGALR